MADYFPGVDKRLTNVKWGGSKLGMLFLRVLWSTTNITLPKGATATTTGLPQVFQQGFPDLLVGKGEKADPETDPKNKSTTAEPISDLALEKWLYWNAKPPFENRTFRPPAAGSAIYYATYGPDVDHDTAFDIFPDGTDLCGNGVTNMAALGGAWLNCNSSVTGWLRTHGYADVNSGHGINPDRSLVERFVEGVNAQFARNGEPLGNWRVGTYINGGAGDSLYTLSQVGITTLNLDKLRKYQTAVNGKKPDTMSFKVRVSGGDLNVGGWNIEGWMIRAKAVPGGKKGHATRVFPVSEILYYPQWGAAATNSQDPGTPSDANSYAPMDSEVTVTINFKTFKLTMSQGNAPPVG